MMESMLKENGLSFKEIEEKIFRECCSMAAEVTGNFLEEYDRYLHDSRDKKAYRDKGLRRSTVKTVYGEVEYRRHVYEDMDESGTRKYVYLLDETLDLKTAGLISQHYAEKLVSGITTKSYRNCAEEVSATTGQTISAMGVWNIVQALGWEITGEEKELAKKHRKTPLKGKKEAPVLFEETDGVNIKLQGRDRKATKNGKAEMKVAICYDGWKQVAKDRYLLDGKVAYAGFSGSKEFHRIREAKIASEYNLDETQFRILNGDGASWIKKVPDKETLFQLDTFHRNKAVRERIHKKRAVNAIMDILEEGDITELFRYLAIYRDSLAEDKEIKDADALIKYFTSNAAGLVPYGERVELPESPEGLKYRNMGTMENHIWSIIAARMKHNHTTWSRNGANNLAKLLAKKCEGKLYEVTDRLRRPVFEAELTEELLEDILPAKQNPERIGKGYGYPVCGSMPALEEALRGDAGKLLRMAGY